MFQNNGTAAMLVYLDNPAGVEFFSYVKLSFVPIISIDAGHVSENALFSIFRLFSFLAGNLENNVILTNMCQQ